MGTTDRFAQKPSSLGSPPTQLPDELVRAILAGDCVAFVGAGFSAAARLPGWGPLLMELSKEASLSPEQRSHLEALVARGNAHSLDQAAQLLEDSLERPGLMQRLTTRLGSPTVNADMRRRLWYLQRIPFRSILTTNFDGLLDGQPPGPRAYRQVLQPTQHRWWENTFWDEQRWPPVVKLHGRLPPVPEDDVVFTRRDYRRRLYDNSAYVTFLRATLATTTVLYLGFSFEDAYLNELRSEVLSMLGQGGSAPPLAYAVANDVPPTTLELYRRHEGIELLPYESSAQDHSGFDQYLEALYEATNPLPRFARFLASKRILWIDPTPESNRAGLDFLRRASQGLARPAIVEVPTAAAGLQELEAARGGSPYDLIITHWGRHLSSPVAQLTAVDLLTEMRQRDLRAPVMVFSTMNGANERRARIMALGAYGYFFRFEDLFQEIERVFAPVEP